MSRGLRTAPTHAAARILLGGVLAAVALGATTSAPAAARAKAPTVSAVGGVRGWYEFGDHVVVRATVAADELVNANVEITSQLDSSLVLRSVQVAAGTEKVVTLVLPPVFDPSVAIEVRLVRDGTVLAKTNLRLSTADSVELVGVMPGLAARIGNVPKTAQLVNGLGRAEIEQISDDMFALGAAALETYDTIVAVGGDLQSLDDAGRANLFNWINSGGRLLLDDDAGVTLLPQPWRPTGATYALAGRGEVHLVSGRAGAGKFAEIIEPSAQSNASEVGMGFGGSGFGNVQEDLAGRAGVRLPSLTPILVGLVAYVVVVGPLCYLVLRRRRRLSSAWMVIPTLALVAAAVVLGAASGWRDNGRPAAVAFVDGYPGGGQSQVTMLSFRRSGGTTQAQLPPGWQLQVTQSNFSGFDVQHRFTMNAAGATFQARLEPGQVTSGEFVGPSSSTGLDVQAVATAKSITGTVTNNSAVRLADVAVFSAGDADLVGALEPGASASFKLDAQPLPVGFSVVDRVWSRPDQGIGNGERSELAEFGVWTSAEQHTALYPVGMVRAAGWTDERVGDVATGDAVQTRTVVTQAVPVEPGDGTLGSGAVRTVQVRSPFNQFGGGNGESAIRYVLPPSAPAQPLVVEAAFGMTSVEFWNGTSWTKVTLKNRLAHVPESAVRDGAVLMRIRPDANFSFDPNQVLLLRGATAKDQA